MERFAKRKVKIMSGRSGNKLVFFIEDSGVKHFVAEFSKHLSDDLIYHDVKYNWYKRMVSNEADN